MTNTPPLPDSETAVEVLIAKVPRVLTPEAKRALAEAEERRQAQADKEKLLADEREYAGRGGKDPVRYNDWEIKGIASDF
jgi:hypothetical protein